MENFGHFRLKNYQRILWQKLKNKNSKFGKFDEIENWTYLDIKGRQ